MLAHEYSEAAGELLLRALEDDDRDVRIEAARVAVQTGVRAAGAVLLDWLDAPAPELREAAVTALGQLGDPRHQNVLVRALGDARAEVRKAAVRALGRLGGQGVVEPLLRLLDEPDTSVRANVIRTLGTLGDTRAVAPLLGQEHSASSELRVATLLALEALNDPRALPMFVAALDDDDEGLRLLACRALGRLGSAEALPALAGAVRSQDTQTARAALLALSDMRVPKAIELAMEALQRPALRADAVAVLRALVERQGPADPTKSMAPTIVRALATALARDPSDEGAARYAPALAGLTQVTSIEAAIPTLLAALPHHATPAILSALADSGHPSVLLPLMEQMALAPPEHWTRYLTALSRYFDRVGPSDLAADPLLAILEQAQAGAASPPGSDANTGGPPGPGSHAAPSLTEATDVRRQVVGLLARVPAPRVLPVLRPLVQHPDPGLRLATVRALGAHGDHASGPVLLALLDDPEPTMRAAAAGALGQAADTKAVATLVRRVTQRASNDRHAALHALALALPRLSQTGTLPAPLVRKLVAILAPLLSHPDDRLAIAVFDVLEAWHPEAALKPLAQRLTHVDEARRARAAQALSAYPPALSRPILRHVLRLAGPRTLLASVGALAEVGDHRDVAALLRLADRKHWPIPGAVAYALSRMAARGVLKPHATRRKLCRLAARREPYVRANVAAAMAHLGAGACDGGPSPLSWLALPASTPVRVAAARWARVALPSDPEERTPEHPLERALSRCSQRDPDPQVARACRAPKRSSPPASTAQVAMFAYDRNGSELLRDQLVALRFEDGSVFLGYTDANGRLRLPRAPEGEIVLEDPGALPLEARPRATTTTAVVTSARTAASAETP